MTARSATSGLRVAALSATLAATLGTSLAACAGTPAPEPGAAWDKAVSVARPDAIVSAPMPSSYYHPGHFEGQGYMAGVARTPGGWVAVGYEWPGWHAISWHSADALDWALVDPREGDGTFMNAVASGPSGVVAVGRDGGDAAVWTSADGLTWRRVVSSVLHASAHLRMNAVAAVPGGFVAGGAAGPDIGRQEARIWSSPDGATWSDVALPDAADARVTAVASVGRTIVAVGTRGTEREPSGSIAWTSPDGRAWTRVPPSAGLAGGLMWSVTAGGPGLVAVGTNAGGDAALAWTSVDGTDWRLVASPTFAYHGQKVRMTAVAAVPAGPSGPSGLVAVGNYLFGMQYGFARVWRSPNGTDWSVAPETPAFGQGEMLAVAADPGRVVAVGTFGAPDDYVPTVWISPPPR